MKINVKSNIKLNPIHNVFTIQSINNMEQNLGLPDDVLIVILKITLKITTLRKFFRLRSMNKQFERIATYLINTVIHIKIPKSMIFHNITMFPFRTNQVKIYQWMPVSFYFDSVVGSETIAKLLEEITDRPIKNIMSCVICEPKPNPKESEVSEESFFFLIGTGASPWDNVSSEPKSDQLGYLGYFVKDLEKPSDQWFRMRAYVFSFFSKPEWHSILNWNKNY